ncbi:MAG: hypothetical protein IPP46_15210 [Bacteroidetes bacterium]|nr:hypothetical protein [Bacteroidota bacterium]
MSGILILLFNACNNDGYTKSATGLKYRIVESHNGRKPVLGEMMRLHLKYKDKNGKVIYDSGILGRIYLPPFRRASFCNSMKMIKVLTKSEFEKESTELENKIMDEENQTN